MKIQDKLLNIYNSLYNVYGEQECFLTHKNPLQLMIAVILSAQCTDVRVNKITPALFKKFPDVYSVASAKSATLEKLIKSCGYYNSKGKYIIESCQGIVNDFNGKVPNNMKDLTSLPGIGRKTANVILGNAFGVPGFPVDTHVIRITNRLGLIKSKDPVKIEYKITKNIDKQYWTNFSHILISHGRNRCDARKPDCNNCELLSLCRGCTKRS